MASIQDLLQNSQPNALQDLLAQMKGQPVQNSSQMPAKDPTPQKPTVEADDEDSETPPVQPSPVSPQMLGMRNSTDKNDADNSPKSEDRTPASNNEDDSDDDTSPSLSEPAKVADDHHTGPATDEQKQNLQDLYNNVHSLNTLKEAQSREDKNNLLTGLGQAFTTVNNGVLGLANKVAPPKDISQEFYKEQAKTNNQPVTQLADQQTQDLKDPNSDASKNARQLAGAVLQKAGFPPSMIEGMSHDDILKQFPQFSSLLTHKDATDANRLKSQELHEYQMARIDAMKGQNESKADTKASDAQNKTMQSTKTLLESARGNPAAAQAEKDLYAADKAKSLTNLYGDPNKLSTAQVQLLASEIGKIASGGVPTSHELEGLTPQTLASKFAKTSSELMNKPTPANAAAFVKQYQDYADALTKDAKKVIQDKYGRVIESSKKQLGDDNYKALQDQYLNRFTKETEAAPSTETVKVMSPKGVPGTILKSKLEAAIAQGFKVVQ